MIEDRHDETPIERSGVQRTELEAARKTPIAERLLGAHMPTAGGLKHALFGGKEIGCSAVQLFTSSPRQWNQPRLKEPEIAAFQAAREATGISFIVAHDSYLINLAAPDSYVLERSRHAFRGELDRAEALGIPWVVTHMGAHLEQGEEAAVERIIASLKLVLAETDAIGYQVGIALETTAGQGTGLGWKFEQLGEILRCVGEHPRLGVCLDTCHIFVAGYDLRSQEAYDQTWERFDRIVGLKNLKVIHANDAKKPCGSRVDRHDHIGVGEIGNAAFARLVRDPRLAHIPIIIETPDSETMHKVNLERLRRLAAGEAVGISVDVQFFGHYSDYYGGKTLQVSLPVGSTVSHLAEALAGGDPRLVDLGRHCRFAVNEEYADPTCELQAGMVVAVLPPMSGG